MAAAGGHRRPGRRRLLESEHSHAWRVEERCGAAAADELQDRLRLRSALSRVGTAVPEAERKAAPRRRLARSGAAPAVKQRVQLAFLVLLALLIAVLITA